jgi:Spy/CpxP family protein refolding chaperone
LPIPPAGPLLDYSLEKDTPAPGELSGGFGELMQEESIRSQHKGNSSTFSGNLCLAAILAATLLLLPAAHSAQQPDKAQPPAPGQSAAPASGQSAPTDKTHITPEQAKQLFALVDELIKFSSNESGLPIKSTVKKQLTTRNAVESYIREKFDEDEGSKRLQKDEIVLKKFGLLDHDFALKPFLLALLKEQVEAYYDAKTKTVNLLDWVDIDEQKPVLAHELTHALQDQHIDLDKFDDQTPDDVSKNSSDDTDHLAKDELDTARDAVVEGQATAVMMDYILKPMGKSLVKDPEVMDAVKNQMETADNSPVLARAPILLSKSLLFPYREGLSFEQDVWMDQGQAAAFAGALDHPPTSSWEIINPREFERHAIPAIPLLPDIHPYVDSLYKPYDIGQVGQLDLQILAQVFGGDSAERDLTPAWDGGIYWAGQRKDATTPAEQASTASLALFYLAAWKNNASATAFAQLYATELGRKYSGLRPDLEAAKTPNPNLPAGSQEQVFTTNEGPVVITTRGKFVFISESFPLPLARQLTALILDAQGTGEIRQAQTRNPIPNTLDPSSQPGSTLTGNLVHFLSDCGVMKAAVTTITRAAH